MNFQWKLAGHDVVFDGVFHQQLQRQRGKPACQKVVVYLNLERYAPGIPGLQQMKIRINKLQFAFQRRQFNVVGLQNVAVYTRHFIHKLLGFHGFVGNQRREGIEGIEQKMRIQLRLATPASGLRTFPAAVAEPTVRFRVVSARVFPAAVLFSVPEPLFGWRPFRWR